ncbi:MAG: tRNA uridine-5-carboxymethylaminomethyl(34) synthesis GTPase MnmE [Bacteroidales bacterium]|jgi:tRNA modification GTPase|nr:tRNA uridine-5-carboxymethylaminomethyl(34) synthesis GTPase MnmE [Bacteroidales bacterium]MDD4214285.1 tRNA uridine-5-carboxymethylaminomethyl(34) synthesis GTPase MnmE [Bacteroidales bacterium]
MSLSNIFKPDDTICAISTPAGTGAIALIRISGKDTYPVIKKIFRPYKKNALKCITPYSLVYGSIIFKKELIDHVLLSFFKTPHSYTGEDMAEINCHGSSYIQKRIMEVLLSSGLRHAGAGEFTLRAFFNKKLDLSQAEAIADLIAANSKNAHDLALNQMRGGFSDKISTLRKQLLDFSSLIELELDFGEEDVEFASRKELLKLVANIKHEVTHLKESFAQGNVLKHGIPVAIIGKPNVGKSTLLNALLNEEKALVSEIPGTTRDAIEDTMTVKGTTFRFIDTAGLRLSDDEVEQMGVERTYQKIEQAQIVLYVVDISETTFDEIKNDLDDFLQHIQNPAKKFVIVANKIDKLVKTPKKFSQFVELETVFVSAKRKQNISLIIDSLLKSVGEKQHTDQAVVSNIRHYEALSKTLDVVTNIEKALKDNLPSDMLTSDIRTALHYLGEITGEITTEDILGNIFEKFCIGK